jgi:murein DD-endopeptidase MepM/ murein hydrolase activator NlpD
MLSIAVLTALFPIRTHAMTLGDLHSFFRPKAQALSSSKSQSVQAMPVLEASMSPSAAKGGADITIVDDEAVAADDGPSGSMANINKPKNTQISIYVVKEGDSLSRIAEMFDVSVNTIKWANDISPKGTIRVGQTLTILPVTGAKHTVKKGDTLASVAKQYHGDADEIANYNGIEGSLVVGKEIVIPNGEIAAPVAPKKSIAAGGGSSASSASYAGYYLRPISGGTRTQGVHGYNGVDLAAPVGTPLLASAAGEVIIAKQGGWNGGYGSYVVIKHDNGTQTLYAHASSVGVGVGQYVGQGDIIGALGASGKATGPHVHFEIRGGPRNPF